MKYRVLFMMMAVLTVATNVLAGDNSGNASFNTISAAFNTISAAFNTISAAFINTISA